MTQRRNSNRNESNPRFGKLHWKLTFTYSAVTLGALVLLEAIVIIGGLIFLNWFFRGPLLPTAIENTYGQQLVSSVKPYLQDSQNNQGDYQEILEIQINETSFSSSADTRTQLLLVDGEGFSLAAIGLESVESSEAASDDLIFLKINEIIDEIINSDIKKSVHAYVDGSLVLGLPIINEDTQQSLDGILCLVTAVPTIDFELIRRLLPLIVISLGFFSIGVALIGMVFGYFTSKGLVSRIKSLSEATDQWQKGNFQKMVHDGNSDELADLGRKMNDMARQLDDLIDQRKMLAVVAERNRIAMDLHDSVKQKAYAAAGQISGAREILTRDVQKASEYLAQANDLLHEIRSELTMLINELRPIELKEKTFLKALGDYLENWSRRNQIEIKFSVGPDIDLDEDTEIAVFRLIQEATSNIARHSQADHALVHLIKTGPNIEIVIADDGIGFDENAPSKGFGLTAIKERFGSKQSGSVEISSQPGEGTTVRILINVCEVENG